MKFTKIKTIHKNKYEIHKNRTLGKKPRQTHEIFIKYSLVNNFVMCCAPVSLFPAESIRMKKFPKVLLFQQIFYSYVILSDNT